VAGLSVLSHLIKLVKDGRATARPEPTMSALYALFSD
jgi:hypothetical protein